MKIRMIVPPPVGQPNRIRRITDTAHTHLPYGPACLTAFMKEKGFDAVLHDLSVEYPKSGYENIFDCDFTAHDRLQKFLEGESIDKELDRLGDDMARGFSLEKGDIAGISVLSRLGLPCALLLSKKIKEKTGATVVLGGAMMTSYAECRKYDRISRLMTHFGFIDYIIYGAGEDAFARFADSIARGSGQNSLPGIIYRDGQRIMVNAREYPDINDCRLPDFSDLQLDNYVISARGSRKGNTAAGKTLLIPYQITRGCHHRCSFCNYRLVDNKLDMKDCNKAVKELLSLSDMYSSRDFYFCESMINASYEYTDILCDMIIKKRMGINWHTVAGVCNMDKKLLMKMKAAGCAGITWGVESGSDRILKIARKGFNARQAADVLRMSADAGILNTVNLIIGFPGEGKDDLKDTKIFLKKNIQYIDKVRTFDFVLAPSSLMDEYPEDYGIENISVYFHSDIGFECLGYDEKSGLKWAEKHRQIQSRHHLLKKSIDRMLFMRGLKQGLNKALGIS